MTATEAVEQLVQSATELESQTFGKVKWTAHSLLEMALRLTESPKTVHVDIQADAKSFIDAKSFTENAYAITDAVNMAISHGHQIRSTIAGLTHP